EDVGARLRATGRPQAGSYMEMRDAVVIVIFDAARVLMIRRAQGRPRAGYWMPPSGAVEPGETQEQAVVREAREELGLAVEPTAAIWSCSSDDGAFALHWWRARIVGGTLSPDGREVADARFVDAVERAALAPQFP